MATPIEERLLESMPWSNPIPDWSYAGVAVFKSGTRYIIAPLKKEEQNLHYCFTRALKFGNKMVEDEVWSSFKFGYSSKTTWLHLILKGEITT